jgi:hypothetical protein
MIEIVKSLEKHPYTFMQLAHKEKFHSGVIAYALKEFPEMLNSLMNDGKDYNTIEYKVLVEKESIDILIEDSHKNAIAVIEVKFKSTMHISTTKGKETSQLDKYKKKYKKSKPKFIYIYLFEEKAVQNEHPTWHFVSYSEIISYLKPAYSNKSKKTDNQRVVGTWISYIETLIKLVDFITQRDISSLKETSTSGIPIQSRIKGIKLGSIVDHYRFSLFLSKLEEKKLIPSNCQYYKIDNTHGNGLLHFEFNYNPYNFGIQWQSGTLKLYMRSGHLKNSDRDENLMRLSKKLFGEFDQKLNRDGKFRSISILTEQSWDHYDDINNKVEIIGECLNKIEVHLKGNK